MMLNTKKLMATIEIQFTFVRALAIFSLINNEAVSCEAGVVANKLDIASVFNHTNTIYQPFFLSLASLSI